MGQHMGRMVAMQGCVIRRPHSMEWQRRRDWASCAIDEARRVVRAGGG